MFSVRVVRLSEGVEWAVHCCTILALLPPDATLPAARLAEYHGVPPAYLAKHLQALSRAGIVAAEPGARGGYRLAKPATVVTLLDVVRAVDGTEPAFRCMEIRQRGPAALPPGEYGQACAVTKAMARAEAAWREALRSETIADLVTVVGQEAPRPAVTKAAAWFQEVLH